MIFEVPEMRIWFKVVTTCIGYDVRIQDVNFTYAPAVKPVLLEKMGEDILASNLDVSSSGSYAAD